MKPATYLSVLLLGLPAAAWAEESRADRRVELHVSTAYDDCHFDLHAELTASELREFAGEAGQVVRFRQLTSAETLGTGVMDVSLAYAASFIDDTKGAWNNTMSHPDDLHYLGERLDVPQLHVRVGVTDRIDAELLGTVAVEANYGIAGVGAKIRIFSQADGRPVSLSVRPSVAALLGPSEVQAYNVSADVAVSHAFRGLAPFAGVTLSSTLVVESSPDTDVGNQAASRALAFAGLEYRWRHLTAAAQAELADVAAVALRVGGTF